jgi:hypothetical protein
VRITKTRQDDMARNLVPRYLAALELSSMADDKIQTLTGDIALAAKTSALVAASVPMQTSVAALATKSATLLAASAAVTADHAKLRIDIATEAQARSDILGEVRTYTTLVTNVAKSPADLHAAGLAPQPPRTPRNTPPTVPGLIVNKPPKTGHGKTTVSVEETGPTRQQYVAQDSLDGVTYTQLGMGFGKTRVVTGASGTKVWVRFAMVRGQVQSDWSVPLQITIP